ncbi:MAG: thiamine biosynthesis protein ThiJ [Actinobacteria bacterium RBG_16_68_21]|nr:MAG: thiamine biosynthesis protein ThiJ [Actinobacteria bacterium RBG_16_68_21]
MTTIGIFVFDGAEELDWAGPWEVLSSWAQIWPEDGVTVFTMSLDGEPVTCAKGLRMIPDYSLTAAPPIDVLLYPGGRGTRGHLGDHTIRSWLQAERDRGTLMTSVCTGALVYADAGLLDGRPATTYWSALDLMTSLGTDIQPRPDDRWVDSGEVITAAGVSAGIDMALHLVRRLHSEARAVEVRRQIQYDPQPPI